MTSTDFSYSGSELNAVAEATNYYRWIIDAFSKHIVIPWLSRVEKIIRLPVGQSLFLIARRPETRSQNTSRA